MAPRRFSSVAGFLLSLCFSGYSKGMMERRHCGLWEGRCSLVERVFGVFCCGNGERQELLPFLDVKPCAREGNLTESRHAPVHDVLCDAFARRMRYAHERGTGAGGRGCCAGIPGMTPFFIPLWRSRGRTVRRRISGVFPCGRTPCGATAFL